MAYLNAEKLERARKAVEEAPKPKSVEEKALQLCKLKADPNIKDNNEFLIECVYDTIGGKRT